MMLAELIVTIPTPLIEVVAVLGFTGLLFYGLGCLVMSFYPSN